MDDMIDLYGLVMIILLGLLSWLIEGDLHK